MMVSLCFKSDFVSKSVLGPAPTEWEVHHLPFAADVIVFCAVTWISYVLYS